MSLNSIIKTSIVICIQVCHNIAMYHGNTMTKSWCEWNLKYPKVVKIYLDFVRIFYPTLIDLQYIC